MRPCTIASPAKLNLGLKVLRRRLDGYHDLLSLFVSLDLADVITLTPREDGDVTLSCDLPGVPRDAANLAARAALKMRQETGSSRGVHIDLEKRIPAGGGLGGGSSNAATVLLALNTLWGAELPDMRLAALALEIGSDVPYFVTPERDRTRARRTCRAAVVQGRGEHVTPVRILGSCAFVLVDPGFPVATAEAFRDLRIGLTDKGGYISFLNSVMDSAEVPLSELFPLVENDFLAGLLRNRPEVAEILAVLRQCGAACRSLSGSGSTLYGCFPTHAEAASAARTLKEAGFACVVCGLAP